MTLLWDHWRTTIKISEDGNLASVDCGVTPPIVVVIVFVASKDITDTNFTVMHSLLQFCNQLSKNDLVSNPL